jgi:arylsulfatase A-like enzyme
MMKHTLTFFCALWASALPADAADIQRPNIVFILADDLGYGDLGCYGQKIVPTPNLDRMAAEGMRFTHAYAGSSCCGPSRCSLMTGLHAGHMTVRDNGGSLGEKDTTTAAVLKRAGYATGAFGKWHLGGVGRPGDPNARGFDVFYGIDPKDGGSSTHFSETVYRNGKPEAVAGNRDGQRGAFGDDLFLDAALAFIREHRRHPFFVYLAFRVPHKALEAPAEDMQRFDGKFEEQPFSGDGQVGPSPKPKAARAAMIAHLDRKMPEVFQTLRELDLDHKTLVIFTSDNGPATAGGSDPAFFGSSGGLRGTKFSFYEGGIREPFVARWPGAVPAGQTCDLPFAFCDVLPTLAQLAGAECPPTDGLSIAPALQGDLQSQPRHEYLYWERAGQQAVRTGQWKAIHIVSRGTLELYDLTADPAEQNNVAPQHPDVAARIQAIMKEAHTDSQDYPLAGKAGKANKKARPGR